MQSSMAVRFTMTIGLLYRALCRFHYAPPIAEQCVTERDDASQPRSCGPQSNSTSILRDAAAATAIALCPGNT